jgi:hypothetical protein
MEMLLPWIEHLRYDLFLSPLTRKSRGTEPRVIEECPGILHLVSILGKKRVIREN